MRPVYGFDFEIPGFNLIKTSIKTSVSDYILKHSQTCTLCTGHPLDSKFLAVIDRGSLFRGSFMSNKLNSKMVLYADQPFWTFALLIVFLGVGLYAGQLIRNYIQGRLESCGGPRLM